MAITNNRSNSIMNNNPISKGQGIFLAQLLSVVPPATPEVRGCRGFALQAATTSDVAEFIPGWVAPGVTITLASEMIDQITAGNRKGDPSVAVGVAEWLDTLASRGVGRQEASAHQAVKAAKAAPTTVKDAAMSALDRMRARAAQAAGIVPAPVATAPVATAPDISAIVAQAVAAAMLAVAEAHAKQMAELLAQNAALLNSATEAKLAEVSATAETVTVAKGAKGQATK